MKLDTMLSTFVETYSRDAIESIDNMKNDFGRTYKRHTIELTNIAESCNTFAKWIKGYAEYCVEQKLHGESPTPILASNGFDVLMDQKYMLESVPFEYPQIPTFVSGYMNGITTIIESVNESKTLMKENDVDQTLIGAIDECADKFADALKESFDPGMEKLLWASGYTSKQILSGKKSNDSRRPVIV